MNKAIYDFSGAKVLVIGASLGGIGSAIAEGFQQFGAEVTITGIETRPVDHLYDKFKYPKLDVTRASDFDVLSKEFDGMDILVNCAGMSERGLEPTVSVFEKMLDINLIGTYRACHYCRHWLEQSRGVILNIGSMYGILGSPKVLGYGAAKSGIHQLTKSLAIAWADDGIRVNGIAPGFIETPGTVRGRSDPEHSGAVIARTPAGRWGKPEDIVGPAIFLCSSEASFVTGVTLSVDGGYSAG